MENKRRNLALSEAEHGVELEIADVLDGHGLKNRLENMGIRIGKKVKKLSSVTSKGPLIIEIAGSSSNVALGYGMAKKILVNYENNRQ